MFSILHISILKSTLGFKHICVLWQIRHMSFSGFLQRFGNAQTVYSKTTTDLKQIFAAVQLQIYETNK